MKAIGWLFGGMILGLFGSAAWAATVYYSGWELGIIAWAIGLLVGLGVRMSAKDNTGPAPAIVAVFCAITAVAAGKAGTVGLMLYGSGGPSEEDAIVALADTVVRDWERQGRSIHWSGGYSVETAYEKEHYPPAVWSEAMSRWYDYSYDDRERYLRSYMHLTLLDTEYLITFLADDIVEEKLMRGETVGVTRGGISAEDYSPQVWARAVDQWSTMDGDQRVAFEKFVLTNQGVTEMGDPSAEIFVALLLATLTFWDAIWLGLAAMSAWKLGYGDDSAVQAVQHQAITPRDVAPAPPSMTDTSGITARPMGGGAAAVTEADSMASTRQPLADQISSPREMDESSPIFSEDENHSAFFKGRQAG